MSDLVNSLGPKSPNQMIMEVTPQSTQIPKKQNYIEGVQSIPLPSRGVFYGPSLEHRNLEFLKVRQLNYTDEDILTTPSYLKDLSVFDEILKNTIVDENNFQAAQLMPIDRDTILFYLRSKAFGSKFSIDVICPNDECQHKNSFEWELEELEFPVYEPDIYEELKENGEYEIITPFLELKVRIKVPSIGISEKTRKDLEAKKISKKTTKSFLGTGSLLLIVTAIDKGDGKLIRRKDDIEAYFNSVNLPLSDSRYIKKQLEKIDLKYNTKKSFLCNKCNHAGEDVELPILHPNFFWM